MKKLVFLGNCQARAIARIVTHQAEPLIAVGHLISTDTLSRIAADPQEGLNLTREWDLGSYDLIFAQDHLQVLSQIIDSEEHLRPKRRVFPSITFNGFHPDIVYIRNAAGALVSGPMQTCHSGIVICAYLSNLSQEEAAQLFQDDTYALLDYFSYFETASAFLKGQMDAASLNSSRFFAAVNRCGQWIHVHGHPIQHAIEVYTDLLLEREDIGPRRSTDRWLTDPMADGAIWGVYPEIAAHINRKYGLNVTGKVEFLQNTHATYYGTRRALSLDDFVKYSYEVYDQHDKDTLICERLKTTPFRNLRSRLMIDRRATVVTGTPDTKGGPKLASGNPYRQLPAHQFWRRAVVQPELDQIDPVIDSKIALSPTDRIATAGSCFAQHIAKRLETSGLTYYVAERGEELSPEERTRRNFGVFSARYGNIYTVRQLRQLFERAFGYLRPVDVSWKRPDGRLADPFRPEIEPAGFGTDEEVLASQAAHLDAVRRLFKHLDILIFTLGLTEAWCNRLDGCVYPLAPGVAAGEMDPLQHRFVNFGVNEIVADLDAFIEKLRFVNPRARIILTVSPVPLIATYENRHVLVSNTYSKAALRVVADEISRKHTDCEYFPAFEIITGAQTRGAFFEDDLRSVRPEGVDQVMKIFLKHYARQDQAAEADNRDPRAAPPINAAQQSHIPPDDAQAERLRELKRLSEVVCEEDLIDPEE